MAAIGVKFGQCGNKRRKTATKITERTTKNLGVKVLYFIIYLYYCRTKIINDSNYIKIISQIFSGRRISSTKYMSMRSIYIAIGVSILYQQAVFGQMKIQADLIVKKATIFTADDESPRAEAFAIKNGRFLEIGKNSYILNKYSSNNVIDAEGRAVYPAFIDAHSHFYGYALSMQQADLNSCNSFEEVMETMKRKSLEIPKGWLVGRGWDQNKWPDKRFPDRKLLDQQFPDRPVVLIRIDGHAVLANGEALKSAGITVNNSFRQGEVEIREGRLTGLLYETAADRMRESIPEPDKDIITTLVAKAEQNCFSVGLASVTDAGLEKKQIEFLDSLQRKGVLKLHIDVMLTPTKENLETFLMKGPYITDRLSVRSIKIYADGSLGSRTALLKRPYKDSPSGIGIRVTSADSIRKLCSVALKNGYQVNTHAIGDSAVSYILNIYGEFLKGKNDLRWRIEHCQVVDPKDIMLFGKYSVIPSVQATHATSDMYWAGDRLGPDRIRWAYAYHDLLKQNGWIANGTDFPIENINPILTFYAAVARKDLKGYPENGFQKENALSREEALRSITIWAAKAGFGDKARGSISPGKMADFVILDRDIMRVPEEEIPPAKVMELYLTGKKVYGN
jgi:predicted amidohydrolase YtcJ